MILRHASIASVILSGRRSFEGRAGTKRAGKASGKSEPEKRAGKASRKSEPGLVRDMEATGPPAPPSPLAPTRMSGRMPCYRAMPTPCEKAMRWLQSNGVAFDAATVKELYQIKPLSPSAESGLCFEKTFQFNWSEDQAKAMDFLYRRIVNSFDTEDEAPSFGMIEKKSPWAFKANVNDLRKLIVREVKSYLSSMGRSAAWNELVKKSTEYGSMVHPGKDGKEALIELFRGVETTSTTGLKHMLVMYRILVEPVRDEYKTLTGFVVKGKLPLAHMRVVVHKTDLMSTENKKRTREGENIEKEFRSPDRLCGHLVVAMENAGIAAMNEIGVLDPLPVRRTPTQGALASRSHTENPLAKTMGF